MSQSFSEIEKSNLLFRTEHMSTTDSRNPCDNLPVLPLFENGSESH